MELKIVKSNRRLVTASVFTLAAFMAFAPEVSAEETLESDGVVQEIATEVEEQNLVSESGAEEVTELTEEELVQEADDSVEEVEPVEEVAEAESSDAVEEDTFDQVENEEDLEEESVQSQAEVEEEVEFEEPVKTEEEEFVSDQGVEAEEESQAEVAPVLSRSTFYSMPAGNAPQTHMISPADTLADIRARYGITNRQIIEWNNITDGRLRVGQTIRVSQPSQLVKPQPQPEQPKPSTPKPSVPSTPSKAQTYTISSGDSLADIRARFGITNRQIIDWNNITNGRLRVGQTILVSDPRASTRPSVTPPAKPQPQPEKPRPSVPSTPSKAQTYTISSGDSLADIRARFGITNRQIIDWNNISNGRLHVGQTIYVSKPQTSGGSTVTKPTPAPKPQAPKPEAPKPQAPKPVQPSKPSNKLTATNGRYTITSKDSLADIRASFGISNKDIIQWNNLSDGKVRVGQTIWIEKPRVVTSPSRPARPVQPSKPKPTPAPKPTPTPAPKTMAQRVVDHAASYLGVTKYSARHRQMVDSYNSKNPLPVGYRVTYDDDWCDVFVTHVADQMGVSHLTGRECGVERHKNIFKQKGIWLGKGQAPRTGDIVTFHWGGDPYGFAHHIGFVESVNGNTFSVIEGNARHNSNQQYGVIRRTFNVTDNRVQGFARPKY